VNEKRRSRINGFILIMNDERPMMYKLVQLHSEDPAKQSCLVSGSSISRYFAQYICLILPKTEMKL
jgi:hypothetical protein